MKIIFANLIFFATLIISSAQANILEDYANLYPENSNHYTYFMNLGTTIEYVLEVEGDGELTGADKKQIQKYLNKKDKDELVRIFTRLVKRQKTLRRLITLTISGVLLGIDLIFSDNGLTPDPIWVLTFPNDYDQEEIKAAAEMMLRDTDPTYFPNVLRGKPEMALRILNALV